FLQGEHADVLRRRQEERGLPPADARLCDRAACDNDVTPSGRAGSLSFVRVPPALRAILAAQTQEEPPRTPKASPPRARARRTFIPAFSTFSKDSGTAGRRHASSTS